MFKPGEVKSTTFLSGQYASMELCHLPTGITVKGLTRGGTRQFREKLLKELKEKVEKA